MMMMIDLMVSWLGCLRHTFTWDNNGGGSGAFSDINDSRFFWMKLKVNDISTNICSSVIG